MPGPGVFAALSPTSIAFDVPERGTWSPRHDAALATVAARKLASPVIQRALEELHRREGDAAKLRAYAKELQAQRKKGSAAKLGNDGDWMIAEAMVSAQQIAAEEREDVTAAATVIQTALDAGQLWAEELLAAAHALALGQTPMVPPACQLPRRSPELDLLAARLCDAISRTGRLVGAAFAFVRTSDIDLPLVLAPEDEDYQIFMLLAGPRLLLVLLFPDDMPAWTAQISSEAPSPEGVSYPGETMILYPLTAGDPLAPARAVARLRSYLTRTLEEHLAAHPADVALFPELDDERLAAIFG